MQELRDLQKKRSELNDNLTLKILAWGGGTAAAAAVIATVFSGGLAAPMLAPGFMAARAGTKGVMHAAQDHQNQVRSLDLEIKRKTESLMQDICRLLDEGSLSRDQCVSAYYNLKYMNADLDVELEALKNKLCI